MMPEEIFVSTVYPSIKALASHKLRKKGFSQSRIAKLLGVTQASVSLYLSTSNKEYLARLQKLGIDSNQAEEIVSAFSDLVTQDQVGAIRILTDFWHKVLASGLVCNFHVSMYPFLKGCRFCIDYYRPYAETGKEYENIRKAITILESTKSFARVIPEVFSNIAIAKENAREVSDVIAIPGRIVRIGDRARASSLPSEGGSRHLARILLKAMEYNKEVGSVINIKYDRKIDSIIRKLGMKAVVLDGDYPENTEDPVYELFSRKAPYLGGSFDALIDRGGKGIEPNLYIFGRDAVSVAMKAIRIAELY